MRHRALSAFVFPLFLAAAPVLAAPAASATPDVIAPEEMPAIQATVRSDGPGRLAGTDTPAPIPDADTSAPILGTDDSPKVMPALYSTKKQFRGDGFSYGSSPQATQERNITPAAGLALDVPLN